MYTRTAIAAFRCFSPNDGAGNGGTGTGSGSGDESKKGGDQGNQAGAGSATQTFDDWHKSLDDKAKAHLESHVNGLKTALDSERNSKKDLEKQLRELSAKAEKGSEFEKQLNEISEKLNTTSKRADFMEAAHAAGVKNLKLAWTVAVSDDLFKRDGSPDFDAIKKDYPELFASTTTTNAGAGNGAGQKGAGTASMNDMIRQAAGRG
jgi:hypothetical protein